MATFRIGEGRIEDGTRHAVARLVAAVMVADGRLAPAEIDAAARLDRAGFGPLIPLVNVELERATRGPLEIGPACAELRASGPAVAGSVVSLLSRVAASDGTVAAAEEELLTGIASLLGADVGDLPAAPSRDRRDGAVSGAGHPLGRDSAEALALLGLHAGATAEDATTAYLQLVERYDPLKVAPLGVEFVVLAVRRLADVTAAYERVVG
jgi:uncharacterized tellurite resistance protein B-like protein